MGREIRKVIPNWKHPEVERPNHFTMRMEKSFQPLYDESYRAAITEWIAQHQLWEAGQHPAQLKEDRTKYRYYAEWSGDAPKCEYYRPDWKPEEATWFQVYETVSEGTPVTPPFATREELVEYLVSNGDFWDQKRRKEGNSSMNCEPWTRKQAEAFVNDGWAPSLVVHNGKIESGVAALYS